MYQTIDITLTYSKAKEQSLSKNSPLSYKKKKSSLSKNGAKNMYDDDDDDTDNDRMSSKCMQRNGKHVKGKP